MKRRTKISSASESPRFKFGRPLWVTMFRMRTGTGTRLPSVFSLGKKSGRFSCGWKAHLVHVKPVIPSVTTARLVHVFCILIFLEVRVPPNIPSSFPGLVLVHQANIQNESGSGSGSVACSNSKKISRQETPNSVGEWEDNVG